MSDIAMSVSCTIDKRPVTFLLENIEDVPINEASTIGKHPIPTGDYVSDTMYKEPITMSTSGTFSMNGRKGLIITDGSEMTLENIEAFFQRIKNEGVLCDLVKVTIADNNAPRFMIRRNMALQNIAWVERINSLHFDFSWQQVLQVNIPEYDVNDADANLPDVEDPKTLNFTESLFEVDKTVQVLVGILKDNNLVNDKFLQKVASYGAGEVGSTAAEGGLNANEIAALAVGAVALAALLVVSPVVVAIGAIILYKCISLAIKAAKSKIKKFKVYKNDKKMKKEVNRFLNLCNDVLSEFTKLNKLISVYQVSSEVAHQAILAIDDEYCCFTFTRDNNAENFSLTILDIDGNVMQNSKTISDVKAGALRGLDDCNAQTAILKTDSGYQVFLMNPNEERSQLLTENYILVSSIDMADYSKLIADSIKAYLLN